MKKYILDAYKPQTFPYQCPHCYEDLKKRNIIGYGDYPTGILSHTPGFDNAVLLEFPKCFEKSFLHDDRMTNAEMVAKSIHFWQNNYECEECDEWIDKVDLEDGHLCPGCGLDITF